MSVIIHYSIEAGNKAEAEDKLTRICYEQSVELPDDVLTPEIRKERVGNILSLHSNDDNFWNASIQFPELNTGDEISQSLNVIFGNVSLFNGVKVTSIDWHSWQNSPFKGPAFGIEGIRKRANAEDGRALLCTALKPVGYSSEQLATLAFEFAMGGMDIIKDDHGLANQSSSPFKDRLVSCCNAVKKANDSTGNISAYYPNITADGVETVRRYEQAYEAGAGGVLLSPHLCGLPVMHLLAQSEIPLPIMAHPAFSGGFVQNPSHGFSKSFLYAELWRALGADFSIYPNAGGRFSFTLDECQQINHLCRDTSLPFKTTLPTPGGGVQRQTIQELLKSYGSDTVFLIGGSLYQHPKGIRFATQELLELIAS